MVVGPGTNGRGPLRYLIKIVVSLLVLMLLFEGMVTSFHLLNLPSNLAVFEGVCLLLLTAAAGFVVFRSIWKGIYLDVR
jgi:hypothetical protein